MAMLQSGAPASRIAVVRPAGSIRRSTRSRSTCRVRHHPVNYHPEVNNQDTQQAGRPTLAEAVAQPQSALMALSGFAVVAASISQPDGTLPGAAQAAAAASVDAGVQQQHGGLLLQLDLAIHTYVASHTTQEFRLMADVLISDVFITAAILGWLWSTAVCLTKAPAKTSGILALCWAAYYGTCGAVGHGDPPLVDMLKHLFARTRPSDLHHSYSFPSGHTSAAVFITGAFLVVLLPLALQLLQAEEASQHSSSGGRDESSSSSSRSRSGSGGLSLGSPAVDGMLLGVWGAAWVTTATGRILSESHWLSDTLAGGLLAVATVSGLAWGSNWMLSHSGSSSGSSSSGSGTNSSRGSTDNGSSVVAPVVINNRSKEH